MSNQKAKREFNRFIERLYMRDYEKEIELQNYILSLSRRQAIEYLWRNFDWSEYDNFGQSYHKPLGDFVDLLHDEEYLANLRKELHDKAVQRVKDNQVD